MSALDVFEELRFIIELLVAEQLFTFHFAKRKKDHGRINLAGSLLLILTAVSFVPIQKLAVSTDIKMLIYTLHVSWYIFLLFLSLVLVRLTYEITISDLMFLGISSYSAQHIEYVVVNEILAMGIWPGLPDHLILYALVCIVTCAAWYWLLAKIFASRLKDLEGIIYEDKPSTIFYFALMLIMLIVSAFMGQNLFRGEDYPAGVNYRGALTDVFNCILVLVVQYSVYRISALNKEKEVVRQLLYERQKQYALSKENIDIINQKCHDLKHQLQGLKDTKEEERRKYIEEVEESIMFYDSVVKTSNEVVNTILSEKSLYCEKHKIRLTCIVDAKPLDFMNTLDIYALLGNALDNAIECVSKYEDTDKRVVSLNISAKGGFLCIQTNNYMEGELKFQDGLPVSTKVRKRENHGFGMKSMRHLTDKYGGTMCADIENGIFMLQIVIPMPKEFLRLLNEAGA
ncbi:ATP-binding protein [Clostridium sp. AF19-22AC]|jgi:hypothetical protein|uniref:ATP-binding protein n=1 Tax=Clostridia TaxID=186801 RepID=UPI000E54E983|nr:MULTISPECIES: ATP-binding protein [Clostridia]RHR33170.1 ATP-binding protein [Clostridium sp. AF19-22AC]